MFFWPVTVSLRALACVEVTGTKVKETLDHSFEITMTENCNFWAKTQELALFGS